MNVKPLGHPAYGSIPHIPGSRTGPADHTISQGQADIALGIKMRKGDIVTITEKLDGSCCSVAKINGEIVALTRAGYLAADSPYEQHKLFAWWVAKYKDFFDWLFDGWRVCGEWLAQAHGTRYLIGRERDLFVVFDIFDAENKRILWIDMVSRCSEAGIVTANIIKRYGRHQTNALNIMRDDYFTQPEYRYIYGHHFAMEPTEGVVFRVERDGKFDFMCKYVRPDATPGKYLDGDPVWNWRPTGYDRSYSQ